MSDVKLGKINLGTSTTEIFLSAEELFSPQNENCPPPVDKICLDEKPGTENPEDCDTQHIPKNPTSHTPEQPPMGWYEEDCGDCCHPVTDRLMNYTKIAVVAFTKPGYTNRIQSPTTDVKAVVEKAVLNGDAEVTYIDPKNHHAGTLSNTRVKAKADGSQAYELNYSVSLPIERENLDHLEIITFKDIDFEEMQNDAGTDSSVSLQSATKQLMSIGVSHEVVVTNGATNKESYIYKQQSNGQIWTGPVYHKNPFLGGTETSLGDSVVLDQEAIPNITVTDEAVMDELLAIDVGTSIMADPFAVIDATNSASTRESVVAALTSDATLSRTPDGKTNFVFYTDYANIVKSQSYFPGLKDNNIYNSAPIESIQIFRQAASTDQGISASGVSQTSDAHLDNQSTEEVLVVSSSDQKIYTETESLYDSEVLSESSGGLITSTYSIDKDLDGLPETQSGTIQETIVTGISDFGFRAFAVQDTDISSITSGIFRYSVEIQFKDPAVSYMNEKVSATSSIKDALQDLINDVEGYNGYDYVNNRFKNNYRNNNGDKHVNVMTAAATELVDIVQVVTGNTRQEIVNYVLSKTSLQTGSPEGMQTILDIIDKFEKKLLDVLGDKVNSDNTSSGDLDQNNNPTGNSNPDKDLLTVKKDFNSTVDRNVNDSIGVTYIPTGGATGSDGFPDTTDDDYVEGQEKEKEQFFDPNAPDGENIPTNGQPGQDVVEGCTDPNAQNYNPQANKDNGSCQYQGTTTGGFDDQEPTGTTMPGGGGPTTEVIYGCMNPTALNYNPEANKDNGTCQFNTQAPPPPTVLGCMNPNALNYNPNANKDDGSCQFEQATTTTTPQTVLGCTDPTALNYDPKANKDNGSCQYQQEAPPSPEPIYGCMDPKSLNYNPEATINVPDKCVYPPEETTPEAEPWTTPDFFNCGGPTPEPENDPPYSDPPGTGGDQPDGDPIIPTAPAPNPGPPNPNPPTPNPIDCEDLKRLFALDANLTPEQASQIPPYDSIAEDPLVKECFPIDIIKEGVTIDPEPESEPEEEPDGPVISPPIPEPPDPEPPEPLADPTPVECFETAIANLVAVSIADVAVSIGTFNAAAAINTDQEIRTKDNASDFSDNLSIYDFDPNNPNSVIANMTEAEIQDLPPGVRALILSRSSGRHNWLDHDKDLLKDPRLKNMFRYTIGSYARVEYLSGYESTALGPCPSAPIYSPLSSTVINNLPAGEKIMVRVRPVTIPELGIGTDLGTKYPLYTENFTITSTRSSPNVATSAAPSMNNGNGGFVPATSGIIPVSNNGTSATNSPTRKELVANYVTQSVQALTFEDATDTKVTSVKPKRV